MEIFLIYLFIYFAFILIHLNLAKSYSQMWGTELLS